MTILQALALFTLASPLLLWAFFYLIFHIWADQTNSKQYSLPYYVLGVIGMAIDCYVDLLWGTLIFLQWPDVNRLMLSARMDDLIVNGSGWRQRLAIQIVGDLLEPYDLSIPKQHTTHGKFNT